ncbi:hypothetical protein GCM10010315_53080 [Streptomyces luteosporeus]|uniref:Uncharacterized protein n=1 Tax=Streptomyces luteosporeus TaxID=173856 RepID=A0ABN3U3U3_9ACTN
MEPRRREAPVQLRGHLPHPAGALGLPAQHRKARQGRPGRGRGQAGVEDEGAGGADQVGDDARRAEHRPALAAERLRQRHGRHDSGRARQAGGRHGPAAAVAEHAQAVRVVDQQGRAVLPAGGGEGGQRGGIAVDGEDGVGHGDRPPAVGRERLAHGLGVGVRDDGLAGTGQARAVDEGGVVGLVAHQQGLVRGGSGEGGDGGEVGGVAGGEHEGRLEAAEGGEFLLQAGVQLGAAGDQAGTGGAGAPVPGRLRRGGGDLGVAGQAQVVVARQVGEGGLGRARAQGAHQPRGGEPLVVGVDPVERVPLHAPSLAFGGFA